MTLAIPTRNRVRLLEIALQSALRQSYPLLEILVSNNASSDGTDRLLASVHDSRLRVLTQSTMLGMAENWNACLHAATGEYFLLLNDDDVLDPEAVSALLHCFQQSESEAHKTGFVWCRALVIDGEGKPLPVDTRVPLISGVKDMLLTYFEGKRNLHLYPSATLFRTADLEPGFDPRFALGADTVMWMRVAIRYGRATYLDQPLIRYRLHQNTTLTTPLGAWRKANRDFANYAMAELHNNPAYADWDYQTLLPQMEKRRDIRLTVGLIKHALRQRKGQALAEYARNLPVFLSPYGLYMMVKGMLVLFLPARLEQWLRKHMATGLSRRRPDVAT